MNTMVKYMILISVISLLTFSLGFCAWEKDMDKTKPLVFQIHSAADALALYPRSVNEIEKYAILYMDKTKKMIYQIIDISDDSRTFANTAEALDKVTGLSNLSIFHGMLSAVEAVNPDEKMRNAAHEVSLKIQAFWIDNVSNNKLLYQAFKAYAQGNAKNEQLSLEEHYFIDETMKDFKRAGLELPDDQLAQVGMLNKKLAGLALKFSRNIAEDKSTIQVTRDGLKGLEEDFIQSLKRTNDDYYIISVDYPTYFKIMENCAVEETRKRLRKAFANRAYPENEKLLKEIIAIRHKLAEILKFKSYADLDLDSQMVKTLERAEQFILDLIAKSNKKVDQELDQLIKKLPESVTLTSDGKIKISDICFLQSWYKKKFFAIDEYKIAEYFPTEKTVAGLLDIYSKFFSISFKEVPVSGAWHEDVKLVEVYNSDYSQLLGYLFLDLYPRLNKYSHAAYWGLVPAVRCNGKRIPSVGMVVANFPKSTTTKPSLLKRSDVRTFFHEFGHALHCVLGCTKLASQAGTNVKRDFVEMPSQMLEEWLDDRDILKRISSHYKTGESLPDALIDKILALKTFDSGFFVQRQCVLSLIALNYFKEGAQKDPYTIMRALYEQHMPRFAFDPESHFYASFNHLTGYAAKYYGYLWSKVFALDLFYEILKYGLLNPEIGQQYKKYVIGRGGSADPSKLLKDFLGREPNMNAFLDNLGLI